MSKPLRRSWREDMKSANKLLFPAFIFVLCLAGYSVSRAQNSDKCESVGEYLILKNQKYALCALADCLTFNQVAYCGCDILKGNSISLPFDFGDGENVCTVNEEGPGNGYRVSTYSVPEQVKYPDGDYAAYTCPGELNKGKYGGVARARGSYAQCDGGLCFTSTKGNNFPTFGKLGKKEIICSCPIATNCEKTSANANGHQISGPYDGETGCDPNTCAKCDAGAVTDLECESGNPLASIGIQEDLTVGSATGVGNILTCELLGPGSQVEFNTCFCSCDELGEDGLCAEWSVHDESPEVVQCP